MWFPNAPHVRSTRLHVIAASLLALPLVAACNSDDDSTGTAGPPVSMLLTWGSVPGLSWQGRQAAVADHGVAPETVLRAEWTDGATTLADEVARAVSQDVLVLSVPNVAAGTYTVDLFDGVTRLVTGTVVHAGPSGVGSGTNEDALAQFNADLERYVGDLVERRNLGDLPLDYSPAIDALVGWKDFAVAGASGASTEEVERAVQFARSNGAALTRFQGPGAAAPTYDAFGCSDTLDLDDASRAGEVSARATRSLAAMVAGNRFIELDATYAGTFARAFTGAAALAAFDDMHHAVAAPLVPVPNDVRICGDLMGAPVVEDGQAFRAVFAADYRALETADAGSGFVLRESILGQLQAARPFVASSVDGLESALALSPGTGPTVPGVAASGEVRERTVSPSRLVGFSASSSVGGDVVTVTSDSASAITTLLRLDGASLGADVQLSFDLAAEGLASPTPQVFTVSTGAGMMDLGPLQGLQRINPIAMSADGSVIAGHVSALFPFTDNQMMRWTATSGLQGLGTLATGVAKVLDISADGSTIVGFSAEGDGSASQRAVRWSETDGIVSLGVLDDDADSAATAVSPDGSIIIGYSDLNGFVWREATGMVALPTPNDATRMRPSAMTADGSTIVGEFGTGMFRLQNGVVTTIAPPSDALNLSVHDVSADGSAILGASFRPAGQTPFLWTEAGGFEDLGFPTGALVAELYSCSGDAETAAGFAQFGSLEGAVKWTRSGGYEMLGLLDGDDYSLATDITDDGTLTIGVSGGTFGDRGFRRTAPTD